MPNATYPSVKQLVTPRAVATAAASGAVATYRLGFGLKKCVKCEGNWILIAQM